MKSTLTSTVSHTTLEFGQQRMNYIAQEKQVPPEKLMLGIPFYGRGYTTDGKLDRSYFKTFAELIAAEPANYDRDVYNGVAYNGASTVRVKCNYAQANTHSLQLSRTKCGRNRVISTETESVMRRMQRC